MKIGFIGAGKMAQALAKGFITAGMIYSLFFHSVYYKVRRLSKLVSSRVDFLVMVRNIDFTVKRHNSCENCITGRHITATITSAVSSN